MILKPPTISKMNNFDSIWNLVGLSDGFFFNKNPYSITGIAFFPQCFEKPSEALEYDINQFFRSFVSMPDGAVLSTYLCKSFEDTDLVPSQNSNYELMNWLEVKRFEKINMHTSPIYGNYFSVTLPIHLTTKKELTDEDEMELLTKPSSVAAFEQACEALKNVFDQVSKKFSGACVRLNSAQCANFLSLLLNHTASRPIGTLSSIIASDFFLDDNTIFYGGNYHACLSMRANGLPDQLNIDFNQMFYDANLLSIPFTVQCTIHLPDSLTARKDAEIVVNRLKGTSSLFAPLKGYFDKKIQDMQLALSELDSYNGRVVDVSYNIHLWSENKSLLEKNITSVTNAAKGKEMSLTRDTYNTKAVWHSILPFNSHYNVMKTRMTSMNAEIFIPFLYPPVYNNPKVPDFPNYFFNKKEVRMCFDSMDKRCTVWNSVIAGTSGSGKSFFANQLILNDLTYNTKVFIIDKGGAGAGSYRNIVMNLKGTYIELDFSGNSKFSINFFDGPLFYLNTDNLELAKPDVNGLPDTNKEIFLISMLSLMIQDDPDQRLTKIEEEKLSRLIKRAYKETNNNANNVLSVSNFANNYLKPDLDDDGATWTRMSKYINDGSYAGFFGATQEIPNTNLFCFDLEGIDEHPDLRGILSAIIINFCNSMTMDGKPGQRKAVYIDEAWALLRGGAMTNAIEGIWRTIRKHGGRITCISQDFESIMKSLAGEAIMRNSSFFYMCGSNYRLETLSQIKATGSSGVNSINGFDFDQICTQQFNPPHYSEIFLLNPVFKGTLRFRASTYDYWFSTTDARDKAKLNLIMDKLGVKYVTPEVLEEVTKL